MMKKLFILMMLLALIPSASAGCTLTCYVDDDGTGDYNVDHNQDDVQINAAIAAVGANATAVNRGTVILNYTATGYSIYNRLYMGYNYVTLKGENPSVLLEAADTSPIVSSTIFFDADYLEVKNFTIDGNYIANGWPGGAGVRRELMLYYDRPVNGVHDILIENITGYDTADDLIWGQGYNVTVRNISCSNVRHSCVWGHYAKNNIYGGLTAVANWTVSDITCTNLGNACWRSSSMNGVYLKNLTSYWSANFVQFALEIWAGDSTNYRNQNHLYENITSIGDIDNGIIVQSDPSFTTEFHNTNITFKNVLIDCLTTAYSPSCRTESAGTFDGGSNDRPGAIRIQGGTDITIDGFTIINASIGIRTANYVNSPANIVIKNGIFTNNTVAISQIRGTTNYNWGINFNDFWNNGGIYSGSVTIGDQNMYSDPYLAMPGSMLDVNKYRLKSQYGRWNGSSWTMDGITSPAIDAGNNSSDYTKEPTGENGMRVNMGFDGNTQYASKSSSGEFFISGYVFDNNNDPLEGVFVSTTEGDSPFVASDLSDSNGFFNITYLYNGTYHLTYNKLSFDEGLLNVTITTEGNTSANMTIYDVTAPSVTGLTATKINNSAVLLEYGTDTYVNYYQIYRDGSLVQETQNTYWTDVSVSSGNTYIYNVSANDSYNNQGTNSSTNITLNSYTVIILTPSFDTAIKSTSTDDRGTLSYIENGNNGASYGLYRTLMFFNLSSIPVNSTITDSTLNLTYDSTGRNRSANMSFLVPTMEWTSSSTWAEVGGGAWIDSVGTVNGSNPFIWANKSVGDTSNTSVNPTSILQGFVNETWENHGILIKGMEIENDYYSFMSSETTTPPILTINYTESSSPTSPDAITDDYDVMVAGISIGAHITDLFFNKTGLSPDTAYLVSVRSHNHSYDTYSAWVNLSTTTDAEAEPPANASPSITSYAPTTPTSSTAGDSKTFNLSINQTVNVVWYVNGTSKQTNNSVTDALYTNTSSVAGTYNVTAIGTNANGSDSQTWIWTVTALPTYAPVISSYVPTDLTPTVDVNNLYSFNTTANQSVTWTWTGVTEGAGDGTTDSIATQTWTTTGAKTVTATCSNSNGSCGTTQWDVTVVSDGSGGGTNYDWLSGTVNVSGATITTNPNVGSTTGGVYSLDYVFVDGQSYWINISKAGYYSNNTLITFNEDHEIWDVYLIPLPTPAVIDNGNNYTNNSNLSFSVVQGTTVNFNMTFNYPLASAAWTGTDNANYLGVLAQANKTFNTAGIQTVTGQGLDGINGSTALITWTITVTEVPFYSTTYNIRYQYGCDAPSGLAAIGGNINKLFRTEVLILIVVLLIIIIRVMQENVVLGLMTIGILVIFTGAFLPIVLDSIETADDVHSPCAFFTDSVNISGKQDTWITLSKTSIKASSQSVYNSTYVGTNNSDYLMDYSLGKFKPVGTGNLNFNNS